MNSNFSVRFCILFSFLLLHSVLFGQVNPTINNCEDVDNDQTFCATGVQTTACFFIDLNGFPDPVSEFIVSFGDRTDTIIKFADFQDTIRHSYDLSDFYGRCEDPRELLIKLTTIKTDGDNVNDATFVNFINPPLAGFAVDLPTICVNETLEFIPSCTTYTDTYTIDYGDGSPITTDLMHTYTALGTYTITHTANNECGQDVSTQQVTVIDKAEAVIEPEAGISSMSGDTMIVCLGGGGEVEFSGENSINSSSYDWAISGGRFVSRRNLDTAVVQFTVEGVYFVTLTVDNACRLVDDTTVIVRVIDEQPLQLNMLGDTCEVFAYAPIPFNANATYTVDGTVVTSFPVSLGFGSHTIVAELTDICGAQMITDNISISTPTVPDILSPANGTAYCTGDPIVLLVVDIPGGVWSGSSLLVTNAQGGVEFNPSAPGTYNLTYAVGSGICQRTSTITLDVQGEALNIQPVVACEGEQRVQLVASEPNGIWSSSDCPACIQGDEFVFAPATGPGPFTVTYTISNAAGCTSVGSTTVSVASPESSFDIESQYCAGQTISPSNFTGSVGGQTISWILNSQATTVPLQGLAVGTYTLTLVASNQNCVDSTTRAFEVIEAPDPLMLSADVLSGCGPLDVLLDLGGSGTVSTVNYLWDFDRGPSDTMTLISSTSQQVFTNLTDSIQRFSVIVEASNLCGLEIDSIGIEVLPQPFARIGVDSSRTACSPHTYLIINRSPNSSGCLWTSSTGLQINDCDSFELTFQSDTSELVVYLQLESTNSCGTDVAIDSLLILPPNVTPFFSIDQPTFTICPGEEIVFSDESTPVPTETTWDFGDGFSASGTAVAHTYALEDTALTVSLRVSTGCGFRTLERQVVIRKRPSVQLVVEPVACEGAEVEVRLTTSGVLNLIDYGNGQTSSSILSQIVYDSTGQFTIKANVQDANGCLDSIEQQIVIEPLPVVIAAAIDTACVGSPVQFLDLSTGNITSNWSFPRNEVASGRSVAFTPNASGLQFANLVVSSSVGCKDSIQVQFFVRSTPTAGFAVESDSLCFPEIFTVMNTAVDPLINSFMYSFGDGATPSLLRDADHQYSQAGQYTVRQVVGIDGICFDTTEVIVTSIPKPFVEFIVDDTRCEANEPVELIITTSLDNAVGVIGPNYDSTVATRHQLFTSGEYTAQVVDPFGCDTALVFDVPFPKPIVLELIPDTVIRFGDSIVLETYVNRSDLVFQWRENPYIDIDDISVESPSIRPSTEELYTLTVTDSIGCSRMEEVFVALLENQDSIIVDAPTAFSPNGDGVNDVFQIFPRPNLDVFSSISIYDRWGQQIYFTTDKFGFWDGSVRGELMNPGVFVYLIEGVMFTGKKVVQAGDVTLIR